MTDTEQETNEKTLASGVLIEDHAKYLFDNGLLFYINVNVLHPIGLAFSVKRSDEGKMHLAMHEFTKNPTQTFRPEDFKRGSAKFNQFWNSIGQSTIDLRKELIGITQQHHADYRRDKKKTEQG